MNQALYAHMNNKTKMKKKRRDKTDFCLGEKISNITLYFSILITILHVIQIIVCYCANILFSFKLILKSIKTVK
jgi:hypothetical protein